MVQGELIMDIVEIYKDGTQFMWPNNKTFLCVFDENDNLVTDYDLCSGLKLMQKDNEIIMYVNEDEMVSGKWTLFATRTNKDLSTKEIVIHGYSEVGSKKRIFDKEFPWSNCGPGDFVSREEREKRLNLCKECPLFDYQNMTCTVDKELVLDITREKDQYCPKEKWGEKQRVLSEVTIREGLIDAKNQKDFEEDLEKYLEELE